MIRYILIDDEPKTLERVKAKIDTISNDYQLQHIKSYSSSVKASEEINVDDYDVLIVDFDMPAYNGLELAQKIALTKKIIFLTSTINNEKLVINSLDISGYLSKPFELEEFQKILKNKIIGKINALSTHKKGDLITLAISTNKDIGIYPENIFFISSALISTGKKQTKSDYIKVNKPIKNHVHFYGENSILLFENVRININDLATKLNSFKFEKINQSTIINTNYIKERDNRNLELYHCKEPFKISAKEKTPFLNKLKKVFRL